MQPIKKLVRSSSATLVLLAAATALQAAETAAEAGVPKNAIVEALAKGKVSLKLRARYENVDQTGLADANALTLRTALGYTSGALHGLKFGVEGENILSPDGDAYSQAGLNAGGAGKAVVADPEDTELNQAWLGFEHNKTALKVGRQTLVLDNARFVGDVGWRQNNQSFDAVVLQDKTVDQLALNYAYVDRVNRVFGASHAQGKWDSQSHLLNASWSGLKQGTLTAYGYLLDFDKAAVANSCATYGLSFAGGVPLGRDWKLSYRAEYARQTDHADSALDYETDYHNIELGIGAKPGVLSAGQELLGSDHNVGFKTPLATLHAFNGWADLFLATPGAGLRDRYVKAAANLPADFKLLVWYHRFDTDEGGRHLGDELDLSLSRKFGKHLTALIKYADFDRGTTTLPDARKFWAQVEFVY